MCCHSFADTSCAHRIGQQFASNADAYVAHLLHRARSELPSLLPVCEQCKTPWQVSETTFEVDLSSLHGRRVLQLPLLACSTLCGLRRIDPLELACFPANISAIKYTRYALTHLLALSRCGSSRVPCEQPLLQAGAWRTSLQVRRC